MIKKAKAFHKILLPEYQNNDIENCLVSQRMYSTGFSNLPGFIRLLLPVGIRDFCRRPVSKTCKTSENSDQNSSVFETYMYSIHFCPLGMMESPEKLSDTGKKSFPSSQEDSKACSSHCCEVEILERKFCRDFRVFLQISRNNFLEKAPVNRVTDFSQKI